MNPIISPYAMKHLAGTTTYEVAWNVWDGGCMCSITNKRGAIDFVGEENEEPDIVDLEVAIRAKYYGND